MKTVILSLISEQAIPNVMAALLVEPHPSTMICILPEDPDRPGQPDAEYRRVYDGIVVAFAKLAEDTGGAIDIHVHGRGPISAYSFLQVKELCQDIREEYVTQQYGVIYNITGGTKLMAQAALSDAQENGCRAVYIDTESRKLVEVVPQVGERRFAEERLHPLDVQHYLTAYGLGRQKILGRRDVPASFRKAAQVLACNPPEGSALAHRVINQAVTKGFPYSLQLEDLTPASRNLLEQVARCLGEDYNFALANENILNLTVDDDMYDFWWGRRWLEWYVFEVLVELAQQTNGSLRYNPPLTDVRFVWDTKDVRQLMQHLLFIEEGGVKIPLPLNELDVAAVRGGRLLVCECKTGKNALSPEHFYKLSVVGKRLGTFADKVYVTDVPGLADPRCGDDQVRRQAVRALTLDIAVVGLEQLPSLHQVLAEPDKSLREQKSKFGLR